MRVVCPSASPVLRVRSYFGNALDEISILNRWPLRYNWQVFHIFFAANFSYRSKKLQVLKTYLKEAHIADAVPLPIFVIKVPPLGFVYREAFGLHLGTQEITIPAL